MLYWNIDVEMFIFPVNTYFTWKFLHKHTHIVNTLNAGTHIQLYHIYYGNNKSLSQFVIDEHLGYFLLENMTIKEMLLPKVEVSRSKRLAPR